MIGRPLIRLDTVDSTQRVVFDLAHRDAPEGTTVRAGYQSGGRGRAGRAWTVPAGEALLFSTLLRPDLTPSELAPFSLLVGEAIASVLEDVLQLSPQIKWPNDVLLDGRKVTGILIQTRPDTTTRQPIAVVGIGMNVSSRAEHLPDGATSLAAELGRAVDSEHLFRAVLAAVDARYQDLLRGDTAGALARVNQRLWLVGQQVRVDDAGRLQTGRLAGVDETGALILESPSGRTRIVSGELTRGPRLR